MELRKARPQDLHALQQICHQAYTANFHAHWTANGLELYLEKEFSETRLIGDLQNKWIDYFFIVHDSNIAGFMKVNRWSNLPGQPPEAGCELEKIYVLPQFKGYGLGSFALAHLIADTRESGKQILFLCVIDTNESAIAVYEKSGFKFHSKTKLEAPFFREELRGMNRMFLNLYR
ncbi:GNAT family N-acetyltransferase [Chitinophaga sp. Hz27]|uniref:GNAT family N-acetyltransferase n=1 Tax=Chitinophaga sp. Hz27 TaxID=3347169 RepID=UPI0035DEEDEE